jgi:hypothetical protein
MYRHGGQFLHEKFRLILDPGFRISDPTTTKIGETIFCVLLFCNYKYNQKILMVKKNN